MRKLRYPGIQLPTVWIAGKKEDVSMLRDKGIPYIISDADDEWILKVILFRYLERKFPHIRWGKVLGVSRYDAKELKVQVADGYRENPGVETDIGWTDDAMQVSDGYRETAGGVDDPEPIEFDEIPGYDFFQPSKIAVNIEALQCLKILPTFMDDIASAIKKNLAATSWCDGWNKKLGLPLGSWMGSDDAPNLMILDTSGSIPRGVSATMISLIDTLRTQANADLIITSGRSRLFKKGEELPSPVQLRNMVGGCNEAREFYGILDSYVLGKHWGNVIVFGDNDAPTEPRFNTSQIYKPKDWKFTGTKIDNLLSFHTYAKVTPGYGRWVKWCCPDVKETRDNSWTEVMD
jgi:hypothetical protein